MQLAAGVPSWVDLTAYPFTPRIFATPEGDLRYVDEGRGRPVVIVHGTPSWSFEWRHVIRALSLDVRVIVPDHLGFGLSGKPDDPAILRPVDHARRLRALVEHLDVRDAILVVHDFGGPIGLPLALDARERISALVAINTWCWESDRRSRRMSRLVRSWIGRLLYKGLNASPRWVVPMAFGDRARLDRATHAHYKAPFGRWRERTGPWTLGVELAGSDAYYRALWARRAELRDLPAALVWGMRDPAFGPDSLLRWREALPDARVDQLETVGHFPAEEAPDRVVAATRALLLVLAIGASACLDPGAPGNLVPKTVAEDPTLPAIDVAGTRLHAELFGEPDHPIIMAVHGGPGTDYRSIRPLRELADDGYRVVLWDQRGTGLSERHDPDTISLEVYLEDLRLVIAHVSTSPDQPLVFIGHSWGAMYVTAFIDAEGDYGGRVKGLILSEPAAFTGEQLRAYMDRFIEAVSLTGEQLNDLSWSGQFLSPGDHERADYQAALMGMRGPPSERHDPHRPTPFWRYGAVVNTKLLAIAEAGFDWTQHLDAFPSRVMFLRGDLNTAATAEHQQELAAAYPDAEIVTMPNVGHEMIWERPEEYLAHARSYLGAIGFAGGVP